MPDEEIFYIADLIVKQLRGELRDSESAALDKWLSKPGNRQLFNDLSNEKTLADKLSRLNDIDIETWRRKAYEQIFPGVVSMGEPRKTNWRRYLAAAAVLLAVTVATFWIARVYKDDKIVQAETKEAKNDIAPGTDKALLKLADGSIINLMADDSSSLMEVNGTLIRNSHGRLTYNAESAGTEIVYNTVTTERGGKFMIALADGSKIWLNAASSLRFPTAFPGGPRMVEITGEGYFEVAKDPSKPFIVKVGQMEVEVLGTEFNIMAYPDETLLRTTLLEGSVRLRSEDKAAVAQLVPGQQAQANSRGEIIIAKNVNTEEVVAWKNGFVISSNKEDLKVIMRQISRWYDVDVIYEGDINLQELRVKVPRNVKLSSLLQALEISSGLNFEVSGKTITVKPSG